MSKTSRPLKSLKMPSLAVKRIDEGVGALRVVPVHIAGTAAGIAAGTEMATVDEEISVRDRPGPGLMIVIATATVTAADLVEEVGLGFGTGEMTGEMTEESEAVQDVVTTAETTGAMTDGMCARRISMRNRGRSEMTV